MKTKNKTKKYIWLPVLIFIIICGMFTTSSCKRSKVENPDTKGPAGYRISLSGTANPSTLYVPAVDGSVTSIITARAVNNDGTPAPNRQIVFEEGAYGYFENYKVSDSRTTNLNGEAQIIYFIPSAAYIKTTVATYIVATLVDDGRLDNMMLSGVVDYIPLKIIPYITQGITLAGRVMTPAGNGVPDVAITLEGAGGNASGVTVTRSNGKYDFYVAAGWYGLISADAEGYSFVPSNYLFEQDNPIYGDRTNLDFVANFESGNTLAADVTSWEVPPEGGTQQVSVYNSTGDAVIDFTINPTTPWIHVSKNSCSTPCTFTITVSENTTGDDRNGQVELNATTVQGSSVTINITQKGKEVASEARLEVDKQNLDFTYLGGQETVNAFNRGTQDAINYIITPSDNWITVSKNSGNTDDYFDILVGTNNTGSPRTGKITLTVTTTGVANSQVEIIINQEAGAAIAVSPETYTAKAAGLESFVVYVYNKNTSDILYWSATNLDAWIYFTPANGTTGNSFTVTIQSANPTSNPRQGVITVTSNNGTSATVVVTQEGS